MKREPTISRYRMPNGTTRHRVRAWENGERVTVAICATVAEAEAEKAAYIERSTPVSHLTVAKWTEDWLDGHEAARTRRSIETSRALLDAYIAPSKLGKMGLREVKPEHVRSWIHDLARRRATRGKRQGELVAEQTMRNALYLLSAAFRDGIEAGKCRSNPARGVRPPKRPRVEDDDEWTFLTLEEIAAVLRNPKLDAKRYAKWGYRAALTVAIYAGLRPGELWGLRWKDVVLEGSNPQIIVRRSYDGAPKNGKSRRVGLLPPALAELVAWKALTTRSGPDDLVWIGKRGPHVKGYDAQWERLWKPGAGIRAEVRFYDLRHTYGSHLVSGSWGRAWRIEEVQVSMGHAELKTTQRYAHLAPESLERAAQAAREQWST